MVTELIAYLEHVLHVPVMPLRVTAVFPLYLKEAYDIQGVTIQGQRFLAAIAYDLERPPTAIQKQLTAIEDIGGLPVILVCQRLQAWQRDRLIKQQVQFVIPGNQMYLPMIGLDLREHFRAANPSPENDLSPAAQLIAVVLLDRKAHSLASLAEVTGYAKMTVSRALDELNSRTWISALERDSIRRIVKIAGTTRDILKALPSPVRQRVFIEQVPEGLARAGLDALAARTMIAADHPVFAVDQKVWKQIQDAGQTALPYGPVELEIWRYRPDILATDGVVNPLQLYLSLKDNYDERVQHALRELRVTNK